MTNNEQIQVFQPDLGEDEITAIKEVFLRSWPGRGCEVNLFEQEFSEFHSLNSENFVTTNSCTEAIFQLFEYLNLKGYDAIMPTNSFVGCANAVVRNQMRIVFSDIDPITGNSNLEEIQKVVTKNTKVILLQHYGGIPAEIEQIVTWAQKHKILVIEDAAGALGSKTKVGNLCGTIGDYGVWSFDSMKMLVMGDGGMIYAKNKEDAKKLRTQLYMGLDLTSGSSAVDLNKKWWEFDVHVAGRRSIMNDISASIGRVQLRKLPANINKRLQNAEFYYQTLEKNNSITMPTYNFKYLTNNYFFPIQMESKKRDELVKKFLKNNIYTTFRYYPLNRISLYENTENFPKTDLFYDRTLLIPQHTKLSQENLRVICETILNE